MFKSASIETSDNMTNPFIRFFGGIMIGIFLAIPFIQSQGEPFGSPFIAKVSAMPLVSSDAFFAMCMVFLGFSCAWVGAIATRKARSSIASLSTVETFRRRRQRRPQRSHHLLR